jgi:hypothetical protein
MIKAPMSAVGIVGTALMAHIQPVKIFEYGFVVSEVPRSRK